MISKLETATVREDFFTKKRSIRCIARWYGVSRNTVRRYLREEERKPYPLSEAGAFLKEHEQEICELYAKCELRCPPLRRVIKNNYDRDISLRMPERFCQPMLEEARRQVYLEEPVDRFETAPGQHLQIDFGEKDVLVNGEKVHLHFFVCKLGYSRRIYLPELITTRLRKLGSTVWNPPSVTLGAFQVALFGTMQAVWFENTARVIPP